MQAVNGAGFDIGKMLSEDRLNIPLATVKRILLRPEFLNSKLQRENLGLSAALRNFLRDRVFAEIAGK
ncbi:MAG: hypothetical protein ACRD4K_12635 [Candidatus Acidiferrales bacterium]